MTARRTAQASAALMLAGAVALAFVPYFGADDDDPDRLRYAITFASVYAVPAVVAWLGVSRGTPRYSVAAAVVLLPLSVLSIVLIPFVVPAFVLGVAAARLIDSRATSRTEVAVSVVVVAGPILAMVALLANQEWAEWQTPTGRAGGEQTTFAGYVQAWGCLVVVLVVAFVRDPRSTVRDVPGRPRRSPAGRRA